MERSRKEGEPNRASEEVPTENCLAMRPTPGSIFPEGMDQELTGLLPNLDSSLHVCPSFSETGGPNAEVQDSFPI